jgi:hypothetical protein
LDGPASKFGLQLVGILRDDVRNEPFRAPAEEDFDFAFKIGNFDDNRAAGWPGVGFPRVGFGGRFGMVAGFGSLASG